MNIEFIAEIVHFSFNFTVGTVKSFELLKGGHTIATSANVDIGRIAICETIFNMWIVR